MPMSVVYATVNGRLVQENRGGAVTRYVADTLGSVIQTRDGAGNQTSSTTYWPFGEVRTSSGTNPSPWGFCGIWGYFKDAAARLYVRARILRVDLSRWMTVDPLWPDEDAYGYVDDDPISVFDPSGTQGQGCTGQNFTYCKTKCASLGGVRRCVQNRKTKKLLECSCKNKPKPINKGGLRKGIIQALKQLNFWSNVCAVPCLGAFVDCIYDLYKSTGDVKKAACFCYEGYKEAGDQGNGLQNFLFDLSCGKILRVMQAICEGKIDLIIIEVDIPLYNPK